MTGALAWRVEMSIKDHFFGGFSRGRSHGGCPGSPLSCAFLFLLPVRSLSPICPSSLSLCDGPKVSSEDSETSSAGKAFILYSTLRKVML